MTEFSEVLTLHGLRVPPFDEELKPAFWEQVAKLGMQHFSTKAGFMDWVYRNYVVDKNRFAASACWDIIKLTETQVEGKADA